ncbi:MAG: transposase [Chloroflexi bacterium]|nr:transposase [Chloroflexota bacterium]
MTDFLQDHPDGVILALDQMSLYFQATLTRVWAPVGQTPTVAVHPQREQVHFYGALNLRDGRETALSASETTSEMTANFLLILLMLYPQPILLLLDRAPWHFGEVTDLIEQTDRLQVVYFPPACPDLNPQEHVWARARDAISHNHTYRQFQPLIVDFESYLNETWFSSNFMDAYSPLGLGTV